MTEDTVSPGRITWLDFGGFGVDIVPHGSLSFEAVTSLEDKVPSHDFMTSWLQSSSTNSPPLLNLGFPTRQWDTDVFNVLWTRISNPWWRPAYYSPSVTQRSAAIVNDLFESNGTCQGDPPTSAHACLHLRRGDRLKQYPEGCARIQKVLENVRPLAAGRAKNETEIESYCWKECKKYLKWCKVRDPRPWCAQPDPACDPGVRTNLFVYTDETDEEYLANLRMALEGEFPIVRLESDIDWQRYDMPAGDLFFRYRVLTQACRHQAPWTALLDYRPDNLCPHGGAGKNRRTVLGRELYMGGECVQC